MNTLIRKLTSRKLWVALAGVATGVAIALGADTSDVEAAAGAVTALLSAVAYIAAEGYVDSSRIKNAAEALQKPAEEVE